ncbi:thioredoxin domain-containing protein [Brevundimonas pishanensis]|uniref:thioredoxin domain-containing protein n=1 Tax=Brevundimonas pishanensis TaxID=2896315 RepID=UPI001FA703DC|nr:thioredoxin domain-containing protein [Brevundimonas pishanensis]
MTDMPPPANNTAVPEQNGKHRSSSGAPSSLLAGAAVAISAAALVLAGLPYLGVGPRADVRGYLLQNPQILDEMLEARQSLEDQSATSSIDQAVAANPRLLEADTRDPMFGPADAKVTVIQFFDYRCPGCKAVAAPYRAMMDRHPEVRFIFKEWPILDNGSTVTSNYAARAALAAHDQGKYLAVHDALMAERALDEDAVNDILKQAGVEMAKANQFMTSPEAVRQIADIHTIGATLRLRGTPTFFVNGKTSASIDPAEVEKMIEAVK